MSRFYSFFNRFSWKNMSYFLLIKILYYLSISNFTASLLLLFNEQPTDIHVIIHMLAKGCDKCNFISDPDWFLRCSLFCLFMFYLLVNKNGSDWLSSVYDIIDRLLFIVTSTSPISLWRKSCSIIPTYGVRTWHVSYVSSDLYISI